MERHHMRIKDDVSNRFSRWAGHYDTSLLQNIVFRNSHRMFAREIDTTSKRRIHLLDVGCGTGELVFKLTGLSYNIKAHGVDISKDMIRIAKSKLRSDVIEFKVGDVEDLPYEDEQFDIITCSHSFHHYPDQRKALKEMHRVLKERGKIMIIDGSRDKFLGKIIFGKIIKRLERDVHHLLARDMTSLLQAVGFTTVMQRTFNRLIPLLFTIATKKRGK